VGGKRNCRASRCGRCRMHDALCVCSLIPQLTTRHRWVYVQHFTEEDKTTNTGRLAHLAMPNSQRAWFRSRTAPPEPLVDWGDPEDLFLLFPRSDAHPIDPALLRARTRPATLVVLDGTWKQTRKMARTIEPLPTVRCVGLPEGAHARYSLRDETLEGGMSTLDAVSWLVQAAEGPNLSVQLDRLNKVVFERTMVSRGTPVPGGPRLTAEGLVE
jgi:DTW domain-containing protein YfiP